MKMRKILEVIFLLCPLYAWSDILKGHVVGISDGDTITLLVDGHDQVKIRLSGIDLPEKKQPFGQRAKEKMSDLVYDRDVAVEWEKKDRYGRTIGVVMVDDKDAGLELIRSGLAWHYKQYERDQPLHMRIAYAEAELSARTAGTGVWSESQPIPPWIWRHNKIK
jgi:endonuclease YncB( thermonuclease family)